jgi:DeoR family transcriptional regulator, fructose operon transcriptional repressor
MLIAQRQSRLQEVLAMRGMSDLESLCAELRVSQSTVRRDIDALEQKGLAKRTHGGVIWIGERSTGNRPYAFDQRMGYQLEAKQKIAATAKQLVSAGETILLDGGTTTFYLAQELLGMPLQLVTNSLPIANLFLNDDNVELVLTGGLMYPRYGVLLGPQAEKALETMHTRTLFFSVAGIHEGSLYNQNLLLVQSELKMMAHAQQVVLLVDSGKFAQQALSRLCSLDEVDVVVTDSDITTDDRKQIRAAGCELIVANGAQKKTGG